MILDVLDWTAGGVTVGYLLGVFSPLLAIPAAIYFCFQIYDRITRGPR